MRLSNLWFLPISILQVLVMRIGSRIAVKELEEDVAAGAVGLKSYKVWGLLRGKVSKENRASVDHPDLDFLCGPKAVNLGISRDYPFGRIPIQFWEAMDANK